MSPKTALKQLHTETLARGQIVILTARWILITTALFLTLVNPPAMNILRFQIGGILALALANFYLCAQVLLKRRTLEIVTYGASAADIAIITLLLVANGGVESGIYVFYFPALLAMSVAFPLAMMTLFTGGTLFLYTWVYVLTVYWSHGAFDWQALLFRWLAFTAMAVIGYKFSEIERRKQARASVAPSAPRPAALAEAVQSA
jgi:hypothetical protein